MAQVTELIIRDEKYRQVVKATPALLSQMINLLSVAEGADAKKLVLRMISSFGSGSENKMLVGRQGAFQTMLELLAEGDEDLSREVLKTLKVRPRHPVVHLMWPRGGVCGVCLRGSSILSHPVRCAALSGRPGCGGRRAPPRCTQPRRHSGAR